MSHILGIDGGGTKTVALVADWSGRILGQGLGGPSNYHTVGVEPAIEAIREAVRAAMMDAGLIRAGHALPLLDVASLGLAGTGRPGDAALMQASLESARIAGEIHMTHDAAIALAGATACEPGVIVVAGTGAISYGINAKGETKRVDGWGHLIGDAGSAYDIARSALAAAFRAHDGRGPETALGEMLVAHFQTRSMEDIIGLVYTHRETKQHVASAAPLVSEAAAKGDGVALSILHRAGQELGLSAVTVLRGLGMMECPAEVACAGGMFRNPHAALTDSFQGALAAAAAQAKVITPRFSSAVGALLIALKAKGHLTPKALHTVETSCKDLRLQVHE